MYTSATPDNPGIILQLNWITLNIIRALSNAL
jgi:hypothetical protein